MKANTVETWLIVAIVALGVACGESEISTSSDVTGKPIQGEPIVGTEIPGEPITPAEIVEVVDAIEAEVATEEVPETVEVPPVAEAAPAEAVAVEVISETSEVASEETVSQAVEVAVAEMEATTDAIEDAADALLDSAEAEVEQIEKTVADVASGVSDMVAAAVEDAQLDVLEVAEASVPKLASPVVNQDGILSVSFERLASFEYEMPEDLTSPLAGEEDGASSQIPEEIRALNEQSISLKGFMLPLKVEEGLVTEMLIMRDQSMCCYGTVPKINEWVSVRMEEGKGVKPVMDQAVTLVGKLKVGEIRENGYLVGIYEMDGNSMDGPADL